MNVTVYGRIPLCVLASQVLCPASKITFCAIFMLKEARGKGAYIKVSDIMRVSRLSDYYTRACLRDLERHGFLKRAARSKRGTLFLLPEGLQEMQDAAEKEWDRVVRG